MMITTIVPVDMGEDCECMTKSEYFSLVTQLMGEAVANELSKEDKATIKKMETEVAEANMVEAKRDRKIGAMVTGGLALGTYKLIANFDKVTEFVQTTFNMDHEFSARMLAVSSVSFVGLIMLVIGLNNLLSDGSHEVNKKDLRKIYMKYDKARAILPQALEEIKKHAK